MRFPINISVSISFALLLFLLSSKGYCQYKYGVSRIINKQDSVFLSKLPEKTFNNSLRTTILPYKIDNSKYKYFRDVIGQDDPSCGQHASVVYTFTYEINRLRDLASDIPENQYPSHFTYNFMNGGYGWLGVSIHHSFEILKKVGCPTVADFGGVSCDPRKWMNGYDKYHNAMSNRIKEIYQIKVGDEAGLITLKNWLHNHLEGDNIGGLATFYANTPWNLNILEEGTPDEGMFVIPDWKGPPTHSMAIVGYNDSIRFDYNDDGEFTNNIDLNNDGVLDMKDWEIGALIFVDGFYDGLNFADSGFCYMMYKTLAETYEDHGIWNNTVLVIEVDEPYKPELTARIKIKHDSREMINVIAGVSGNYNASSPEASMQFPIYNFQGGHQYMQGGNSPESNKIIEFGLDISPLLNHIEPDNQATFFLQIMENDPYNSGTGEILEFEIFRYDDITSSASCITTPFTINNNNISTLKINFNPGSYNKLKIIEENIPEGIINQPYSFQLHATGGEPEYNWHLRRNYSQISQEEAFPVVNAQNITPVNEINAVIPVPLDFSLPFYGETYDTIYIHTDGFLMFEYTNDPWPYMHDEELMIRSTKCIAAFNHLSFQTIADSGEGIWMEKDSNNIGIYWKVSSSLPLIDNIEFACKIFHNGQIQFFYKKHQIPSQVVFSLGISNGDNINFITDYIHNIVSFQSDFMINYLPVEIPESLQLSSDGMITGFFNKKYNDKVVEVMLADARNNFHIRKYDFYTSNLGFEEYQNDDDYIDIISYPNPFSSSISLKIYSDHNTKADISLYEIHGKVIRTLYSGKLNEGESIIEWDGNDHYGRECGPGIYIIRVELPDNLIVRKIIKQ